MQGLQHKLRGYYEQKQKAKHSTSENGINV